MRSKKLNIFSILITGLLLIPQQNFAQAQDSIKFNTALTLEGCVQYALENNYSLQSTRLEGAIAETLVKETRAIGLPQATVSSGVNYNYEIQQQFLPNSFILLLNPNAPLDPEGQSPAAFSTKYSGNANFSVSQLLFDGSYFVGLQAAKTLRQLRQKESNQSEIATVESVTKAYYTVLINQERQKLLTTNIQQLEKLFNDTKTINENGFAENIDVDRVKVNLNNLKTEKKKVDRGVAYAMNILKFQMGVSLETEMSLAGSIKDISLNVNNYLADMESFNYNQRIEYEILKTNEQLTMLDLKNNKISHLPNLSANFNYGYNTGVKEFGEFGNSGNWLSFGAVGVSLRWRIFTGLERQAKIEKNEIQLDQIGLAKKQLESAINMEIAQLKDNLRSASESLKIQEENKTLANRVFEQTQIKYKNGVGSNTEVIEAETARKTAETNYYSALYDAVITKIELEKALGILY